MHRLTDIALKFSDEKQHDTENVVSTHFARKNTLNIQDLRISLFKI